MDLYATYSENKIELVIDLILSMTVQNERRNSVYHIKRATTTFK